MSAPSQITFVNECHSSQLTEKRDAAKRIPRPPNAFILYRSDLLKRRTILPEVEKRQQNLSRIAGQCWNMLPEAEKNFWFSKAAVIRAEHHAKYPFYETGSFRKDTKKRLLAKDKRKGRASDSAHSSGRFKTRRTRTPYCEGMFAALHDTKLSSPEFQASLMSPTPTSESPSSVGASLSPLTLPHPLSPFTFDTHTSRQGSPSAASDNFPGSEALHSNLSWIVRIFPSPKPIDRNPKPLQTPHEIASSGTLYRTLRRHEDIFAFCVPYPCLGQPSKPPSDAAAQIPLTLPKLNIFPPVGYDLAERQSLLNGFNATDTRTHFNQFLIPLYPWHNEKPNTSK